VDVRELPRALRHLRNRRGVSAVRGAFSNDRLPRVRRSFPMGEVAAHAAPVAVNTPGNALL